MAKKQSWLVRGVWIVAGTAAACGAVFLLATEPGALAAFLAMGLAVAIVAGIAVRLVRAPKGRRLRQGFGPLGDAAEQYQQQLTGREPTAVAIERAFPEHDDKASSGI